MVMPVQHVASVTSAGLLGLVVMYRRMVATRSGAGLGPDFTRTLVTVPEPSTMKVVFSLPLDQIEQVLPGRVVGTGGSSPRNPGM